MALKDLEQNGDEDFNKFDTRETIKSKQKLFEALAQKIDEKTKEEAQEQWLDPTNDALWTNSF